MLMSVHCEVSLLGRKTEKYKASLQDYSIFKVFEVGPFLPPLPPL